VTTGAREFSLPNLILFRFERDEIERKTASNRLADA
jgi:hypothetical protein